MESGYKSKGCVTSLTAIPGLGTGPRKNRTESEEVGPEEPALYLHQSIWQRSIRGNISCVDGRCPFAGQICFGTHELDYYQPWSVYAMQPVREKREVSKDMGVSRGSRHSLRVGWETMRLRRGPDMHPAKA